MPINPYNEINLDGTVHDIHDKRISNADLQKINGAIPTSGTLILLSTGLSWTDNRDGTYSQPVVISGSTANTKVDLQVSISVIEQMQEDKITALYILNDDGDFYAVAVGNAPTDTITVQYTRTEVVVPS